MNSSKLIHTESWLFAQMVSLDDSIHVYSPIRLITLKSESNSSQVHQGDQLFFTRILLASIRQRGFCPCPRCLVTKTQMKHMGMEQDMRQRKTELRRDDEDRKRRISQARDLIHIKKTAVSGKAVEELLKYDSLTPISVSRTHRLSYLAYAFICPHRTPFPPNWVHWTLIFSQYLLLIWCMNLSWASGKPC